MTLRMCVQLIWDRILHKKRRNPQGKSLARESLGSRIVPEPNQHCPECRAAPEQEGCEGLFGHM